MIIGKRRTPNIIYRYSKKLFSGVFCILCLDGNHALGQEHVHRVYTVVLGLQFVYTPRCTQTRFGVYIPDMHVCFCHISSAYTSTLHESFYVIDLASAHMPARVRNEKRVVSSTCHMPALSSLN